jgi:uncharacterized membrane protein
MHTVYLFSVFLHLIAAMTWVGGMIFLVVVVVPMLRRDRERAGALMRDMGRRFRPVGWVALVILVVTGVFNVYRRGYGLEDFVTGTVFAGQWGRVLAHKLTLVGVILVMSAVHDFKIGPEATRLMSEGGDPARAEKLRKTASVLGRITFALALAVVALAVSLVRG